MKLAEKPLHVSGSCRDALSLALCIGHEHHMDAAASIITEFHEHSGSIARCMSTTRQLQPLETTGMGEQS